MEISTIPLIWLIIGTVTKVKTLRAAIINWPVVLNNFLKRKTPTKEKSRFVENLKAVSFRPKRRELGKYQSAKAGVLCNPVLKRVPVITFSNKVKIPITAVKRRSF
jgi:hypothetical protein